MNHRAWSESAAMLANMGLPELRKQGLLTRCSCCDKPLKGRDGAILAVVGKDSGGVERYMRALCDGCSGDAEPALHPAAKPTTHVLVLPDESKQLTAFFLSLDTAVARALRDRLPMVRKTIPADGISEIWGIAYSRQGERYYQERVIFPWREGDPDWVGGKAAAMAIRLSRMAASGEVSLMMVGGQLIAVRSELNGVVA
jgi:hypothetical protein